MSFVVTHSSAGQGSVMISDVPGPVEKLAVTPEGLRVKACGQWGVLSWSNLAALVAPSKDLVAAQRASLVAALASKPGVIVASGNSAIAEDSVW